MKSWKLHGMAQTLLHSGAPLHLFSLLCVLILRANSTNFKGSFSVAGGKSMFGNPVPFHRQKLTSAPFDSKEVENEIECFLACAKDSRCRSTNYKTAVEASGKFVCHLLDTDKFVSPGLLDESVDHQHYSFVAPCEFNPCMNGSTCQPINNDYDFKCACSPGFYGKLCNMTYQSCADLLNAGYNKSGIYLIKPAGQSDMISVYCDQTNRGGGWTMVFKVVSGVSKDIYQLWLSADSLNENKTEALNIISYPPEHYKNRFVPNWQTANPKEVRLALYNTDGSEALSIVFNATSTNSEDWFSKARMIHSPWTDVESEPQNYFSVSGYSSRSFYINRNWGGCSVDAGWLIVSGGSNCVWDTRLPSPMIIYSALDTFTNWNNYDNVGVADIFIVYIR